MTAIRFRPRQEVEFEHPSVDTPEIEQGFFFGGSDSESQMFEVFLPPDYISEPHAHSRDEIITVTAGELDFGAYKLTAGDAVSVPANTLYGFRVGPDGARFLNFRARGGADYQNKEEFLRRREERKASGGAPSTAKTSVIETTVGGGSRGEA